MAWCLIKSQEQAFKQALIEKKINPFKLADMTSEQRRALFEQYVDPENAININALYESKLLLKNRQKGFESWVKRTVGMAPDVKRDLLSKIERMNESVLNPKDLQDFKEDLARTRLGLNVTFEEAKIINQLSQDRTESKAKWENDLKENPTWNEDPHLTRKEWINNKNRLEYGLKQVALENYVNGLKIESRKIRLHDKPLPFILKDIAVDSLKSIPSVFKSLMASLDNSFWGRQGIKNLYGSPSQKRIWVRNFIKSFGDITSELLGRKINGLETMDLVKADIFSRPNAVNGKYKAGDYRLGVLNEEAFPTSLPERIPGLGRLFKASETAFSGGALRMRADLADLLIAKADKQGVNTLNPDEARPIGHLVGSLTGRGSLGILEPAANKINLVLFSARFFKANLDTLTAHQFDTKATPFVKAEARKNLLSIVGHVAGILLVAKLLDPESVDEDPRSTNFGKIKVFGNWVDITGGMGAIARIASQTLLPTQHNGEWGLWAKSSTGNWTNLVAGKYGQRDAVDVIFEGLFLNKLSPIASILRDAWTGEMFGGEPFDIKKSIVQSVIPLSIQNALDAKDEKFSTILAVISSEFVGLSASRYKYNDNWGKKTSKEMLDFKDQVGEEKFDNANNDFNRAYNLWLSEVEKDQRYKELSDEAKSKLKSEAKTAIKEKILKEYGYKKKKSTKTKDEKRQEKNIKKLLP